MYALPGVKWIASGKLLYSSVQCSVMTQTDGIAGVVAGRSKRGGMYINTYMYNLLTYSLHCIAKTNTTL